ncbi:MAG: LysM peptidoglycan-binding domain-containing protein [Deltaproteobacteria bacterium]|nr:LysM peptidoglycan-binding domain-containing protein [Deltaproteobacteria bacterium]
MNGNRIMTAITCLSAACMLVLATAPAPLAQDAQETVEHEAGFYYTIQKGDTLWDLSDHFFDSPWLWPELWQENDQIPNPHRIYPGERVRLYQKKGSDTFSLAPPEQKNQVEEASAETEVSDETAGETPLFFLFPAIDKVGFVTKDEIVPLATIFDIKDNQRLVDTGDRVFMSYGEEDADKLQLGSQYTIYRRLLPNNDKRWSREYGFQYLIVGKVEIVERKPDYVSGQVVASYRPISKDDFILPYVRRSPKIPISQSPEGMDGEVILSEEHAELIGDYTVAFIDKGSEDNIVPGQQYSIYHQQTGTHDGEKVLFSPMDYARFIVLHTEKYVSTVLLTQTNQPVSPGAHFRTPVH